MYNYGNILATLTLLVLSWISLIISRKVFHSYASPFGIYISIWFVSLSLFYVGIVRYYDLEWQTLAVFFGAMVTFACGAFSVRSVTRIDDLANRHFPVENHLRRAVHLLFWLGLIGTILYYIKLHNLIGIQSLWLDSRLVRYEESTGELRRVGWIGLARSLPIPCFVLSVITLRVIKSESKADLWAIAILSFLCVVPNTSRTSMLSMIVWSTLTILYHKQIMGESILFRKYIPTILVTAVLFAVYFTVTNNVLQKNLGSSSDSVTGDNLSGLPEIVHYMVSGFPAFEMLTKSSTGATSETSLTFGFFSRLLNEIDSGYFAYPDYVQPVVFVPLQTNIYTYLDVYYLDFGWLGVAIFPFFLGLIASSLFLWMLRTPSVTKIYIVSLIGLCLFQSGGVNRFGSFQTWVWIALPLLILKVPGLFYTSQFASITEQHEYKLDVPKIRI